MGICASAPVSDYASASSPYDAESRHRKDSQAQVAAAADAHKSADSQSSQSNNAKLVLGRSDDIRSLYTFDKVLGKGQFGVTRLVVDNKTGERYACKTISKRKLVNPEDVEDVRREIKVMHHLSGHPNVVTFIGAYEDAHNIHIVMELCTGRCICKGEKSGPHALYMLSKGEPWFVQACNLCNCTTRDFSLLLVGTITIWR